MKSMSPLKGKQLQMYKENSEFYRPIKPWVFCRWRRRRPHGQFRGDGNTVVLLHKTSITFEQGSEMRYGTRSRNAVASDVKYKEASNGSSIFIKNTSIETVTKLKDSALPLHSIMMRSVSIKRDGTMFLLSNPGSEKKSASKTFNRVLKPSIARLLFELSSNSNKQLSGIKYNIESNGALHGQKLSMSRRSGEFKRTKDANTLMDCTCTPQRQGLLGNKVLKNRAPLKSKKTYLCSSNIPKRSTKMKNWQAYQLQVLRKTKKDSKLMMCFDISNENTLSNALHGKGIELQSMKVSKRPATSLELHKFRL